MSANPSNELILPAFVKLARAAHERDVAKMDFDRRHGLTIFAEHMRVGGDTDTDKDQASVDAIMEKVDAILASPENKESVCANGTGLFGASKETARSAFMLMKAPQCTRVLGAIEIVQKHCADLFNEEFPAVLYLLVNSGYLFQGRGLFPGDKANGERNADDEKHTLERHGAQFVCKTFSATQLLQWCAMLHKVATLNNPVPHKLHVKGFYSPATQPASLLMLHSSFAQDNNDHTGFGDISYNIIASAYTGFTEKTGTMASAAEISNKVLVAYLNDKSLMTTFVTKPVAWMAAFSSNLMHRVFGSGKAK